MSESGVHDKREYPTRWEMTIHYTANDYSLFNTKQSLQEKAKQLGLHSLSPLPPSRMSIRSQIRPDWVWSLLVVNLSSSLGLLHSLSSFVTLHQNLHARILIIYQIFKTFNNVENGSNYLQLNNQVIQNPKLLYTNNRIIAITPQLGIQAQPSIRKGAENPFLP